MTNLPLKATHQQTRTFNQQLVLRTIYDRTEVSRADLARLTGLTRTSVSALVADLLRDGLIEETGRGRSTGGKAPIMLQLRPHSRHAIGLDLAESTFSGALVDLRGSVAGSAEIALDGRRGSDAVEVVYRLIDRLIRENGDAPLLGIGIGAPGLVDSLGGIVRWSGSLEWSDLPLASMVGTRFGLSTLVANDTQAAAIAESLFGALPWPHNLVVVRVGQGIGAGIILDGQLYQGDGSGAGEIGHTILATAPAQAGLEPCRCGRIGCLETFASVPAMIRAARRAGADVADEEALIAAFHAGDGRVQGVVLGAAEMLGHAVGALIAALNINHVLIIGSATRLGDEWLAAIQHRARANALPLLTRDTEIGLGAARANDVVVGAAAMLMTHELGLSLAR